MSVKITIELGSTMELEFLEEALETLVDLERDRIGHGDPDATPRERQRLKAAEQLLKRVRGER